MRRQDDGNNSISTAKSKTQNRNPPNNLHVSDFSTGDILCHKAQRGPRGRGALKGKVALSKGVSGGMSLRAPQSCGGEVAVDNAVTAAAGGPSGIPASEQCPELGSRLRG